MPVDVIPPSYARTSRTVAGLSGATDWTTGKDTAGIVLQYSQVVVQAEAGVALTEGDLVQWTAPTSTAPLRVVKADEGAGNGVKFAGAVIKGGAIGEPVTIARDVAYVKCSASVAADDYVTVTSGTSTGTAVSQTSTFNARGSASFTVGQALGGSIANLFGSGVTGVLVAFT